MTYPPPLKLKKTPKINLKKTNKKTPNQNQNEKKPQTNTSALLVLCLKSRLIGEESKKHVPDKNKVNR